MNPLLIAPVLDIGKTMIERFFPDPQEQANKKAEFLKMTQEQDFKSTLGQLEINAKEAAHPSIFIAGWRPFTGWTCGVGLVYQSMIHNILEWISKIQGWPAPPAVDSETLIYILFALLGVGGLRTLEKMNKVTK